MLLPEQTTGRRRAEATMGGCIHQNPPMGVASRSYNSRLLEGQILDRQPTESPVFLLSKLASNIRELEQYLKSRMVGIIGANMFVDLFSSLLPPFSL